MKSKFIQWLYGELPELQARGILDAGAAQRLREHYGEVRTRSGRSVATVIFSVLGAVLVGAGIILLLAHNWQELSRPLRCVVALAPLALSQALLLWRFSRGGDSVAWREGLGASITMAVGASIALVGQTYHISGDTGDFLLTWALLVLPVLYVTRSAFACAFYWVLINAWAGYEQFHAGQAALFWALLGASLPCYWMEARRGLLSARFATLSTLLALCLLVSDGIILERAVPGLWILVYSAMLAVFYLCGHYWFKEAPGDSSRPFAVIGSLGIPALAFAFTWEDVWHRIGWSWYRCGYRYHTWAAALDYVITAVWMTAAVALLVTAVRRRAKSRLLYGSFPLLAAVAFGVTAWTDGERVAMVMFNLYCLALGLFTLMSGIRTGRLAVVNGGLLTLAAVLVARFFDSDLGFAVRGVAFILIGIGFLAANVLTIRRTKGGAQ
jgi:uncharacterized membrane protein